MCHMAIVFDDIRVFGILEMLACHEALALTEGLPLHDLFIAFDCKPIMNDIHEGASGSNGAILERGEETDEQEKRGGQ